jgi:hypothetical protein
LVSLSIHVSEPTARVSEPNVARISVMRLARTGLYAVQESAFDEVQHARAREFEGWASRG